MKEMLVHAQQAGAQKSQLAECTKGLIFYSTPHYGSWLADLGWTLRHVGAAPAPSIQLLKPGLYLMELNKKASGTTESRMILQRDPNKLILAHCCTHGGLMPVLNTLCRLKVFHSFLRLLLAGVVWMRERDHD